MQNLTNPTSVENPTQVEKTTGVQFSTPVQKTTMVDLDAPVTKTTQVENPTEVPLNQTSLVASAAEQDSSVVLEARAAEGLEKGYTRLPNSILMKMAGGDLTKGEIKILLLIARFTISFQRKLAVA